MPVKMHTARKTIPCAYRTEKVDKCTLCVVKSGTEKVDKCTLCVVGKERDGEGGQVYFVCGR